MQSGSTRYYKKLVMITKSSRHRYREQTRGYHWGEGRGGQNRGGGEYEVKLLCIK